MRKKYEHAVAVTVTIVTHVTTDSEDRDSVKDVDVYKAAAKIVSVWDADDVEAHMEASGTEYIEVEEVC